MKYEVSTDMTFPKQQDRDEVAAYLDSKKSLALTEAGDSLIIENLPDGTYRVACSYRVSKQADRDDIHTYLQRKKASAKAGRIEKHTCRHDAGESCTDVVSEEWGGVGA